MICNKCKEEKDLNCFYFRKDANSYRKTCNECRLKYNKNYYQNNKETINKSNKNWRIKNKKRKLNINKSYENKKYYLNNKDKIREYNKNYYKENKRKILDNNLKLAKEKPKDSKFSIKRSFSLLLISKLKNKNIEKKNSTFDILGYSVEDLKVHIESLFEEWMTWENWGRYEIDSWKEDDKSTWKWNIDHIIPESLFNYKDINDNEFKECWSLKNLRPYSAKLNVLDGTSRIRHK